MFGDFYVGQPVMVKPLEELEATLGRTEFTGRIAGSPTFVRSMEKYCGKRGTILSISHNSARIDFEEPDEYSARYNFGFEVLTALDEPDFKDLPDDESLTCFVLGGI